MSDTQEKYLPNSVLFACVVITFALFWIVVSFKAACMIIGILSLLMFLNISIAGAINAIIAKGAVRNDTMAKVLLVYVASIFIGLGVCL